MPATIPPPILPPPAPSLPVPPSPPVLPRFPSPQLVPLLPAGALAFAAPLPAVEEAPINSPFVYGSSFEARLQAFHGCELVVAPRRPPEVRGVRAVRRRREEEAAGEDEQGQEATVHHSQGILGAFFVNFDRDAES